VRGEAGFGLPGQPGDRVWGQGPDLYGEVAPLVDRREQRDLEGSGVDGFGCLARVVTGRGHLFCGAQEVVHVGLPGVVDVQQSSPAHQGTRPAQHRILVAGQYMLGAVRVGDGGAATLATSCVELSDGEPGYLLVRDLGVGGNGEQGPVSPAEETAEISMSSPPARGRAANFGPIS